MQVHITQSRILGINYYERGYQTGPEKIKAVINLERPKDIKQVRWFLGMVQHYRDLWTKHSEILAPFAELTKYGTTKMSPSNGLQLALRYFNKLNHSLPSRLIEYWLVMKNKSSK